MSLLIKNSISSLSPSINRGWLSVGSRRACGKALCECRQGGTEVSRPLGAHTGLSGGPAGTPPALRLTYASVTLADPRGITTGLDSHKETEVQEGLAGLSSRDSQCYYAGYRVPLRHTMGSACVSQRTSCP